MKRYVYCDNCEAPQWMFIAWVYENEGTPDVVMYAEGVCPACGCPFRKLALGVGEHYTRDIDYHE